MGLLRVVIAFSNVHAMQNAFGSAAKSILLRRTGARGGMQPPWRAFAVQQVADQTMPRLARHSCTARSSWSIATLVKACMQ
jgi:hypothetical protein